MPGTIPVSPVMEFYNDAKIFISGGTGFLGKALIEKFLRVFTNVDHIYLLIRMKKGKEPQERIKELFEDKLFDTLRKERPDFEKKVTCIPGNISAENLSMSENDYNFLINEITHVFHSAATVRFNEKLKSALEINVIGTHEMIKFSSKCKHIKVFVHVSTAYACGVKQKVTEGIYDSPLHWKKALSLEQIFDEEKLEALIPELLKPWPNSYSYTKAIGENLVRENAKFPTAIFRPGVVMGSYKEPVRGWIDNIYGPTGIIAAVGVGLMRVLYANESSTANIVPVDYTVNAMLCCAWEVGTVCNKTSNVDNSLVSHTKTECSEANENPLKIYNFVTHDKNVLTWGEFLEVNLRYGKEVPSIKAIWYYTITLIKFKFLYSILIFLLHIIPATLIDGGLMLLGKKPQLLKAYKKIHAFTDMVAIFAINDWKFEYNKIGKLWLRLNETEKKLFYFDMTTMDWEEYFSGVIIGIRNFIFRENDELLAMAKRKMFFFWLGHRLIQISFVALCFWLSSKFFCMIFGVSNTPLNDQILASTNLMSNST